MQEKSPFLAFGYALCEGLGWESATAMRKRGKGQRIPGLSYRTGPRYFLGHRSESFTTPGSRPGAHTKTTYYIEDQVTAKVLHDDLRDYGTARKLVDDLNGGTKRETKATQGEPAAIQHPADAAGALLDGPRYVVVSSPPHFAQGGRRPNTTWTVRDQVTKRAVSPPFRAEQAAQQAAQHWNAAADNARPGKKR